MPVIAIEGLTKTYKSGLQALKRVDLTIDKGEIFALLGPNGAGKTTLISIVCGIVTPTTGSVVADGQDIRSDFRAARSKIGLVPQELTTDAFETVMATVTFSRGLFGKAPNAAFIEGVLKDLSLWDKRDAKIMTLSGGMKRRVMIAKALSHEPDILFLDEPTAGVDVELRRDMWAMVRKLRERGVTVILTTHYLQEAEELCDTIAIINHGQVVAMDSTKALLRRLDSKALVIQLDRDLTSVPAGLDGWQIELPEPRRLVVRYKPSRTRVGDVLAAIQAAGLTIQDLSTVETDLEDIFLQLTRGSHDAEAGDPSLLPGSRR